MTFDVSRAGGRHSRGRRPVADDEPTVIVGAARWAMMLPRSAAGPTPAGREAAGFLAAKVKILARAGHLDRIAPAVLAMLPALRERSPRHTAVQTVREAAALLGPPREPWEPRPETEDLGHALPWYHPEAGDLGLPVPRMLHAQPPDPAGWHGNPPDVSGIRALYERELGGG
jgi:hypothetical protein